MPIYDIKLKYTLEFLRDMTPEALSEMIEGAQLSHLYLRQISAEGVHSKHTQHPHLFKKVKRDIARLKTLFKEKQYV